MKPSLLIKFKIIIQMGLVFHKLYLFVTVAYVIYKGRNDAPYFPIEISRLAASNATAGRVFFWSVLALPAVYFLGLWAALYSIVTTFNAGIPFMYAAILSLEKNLEIFPYYLAVPWIGLLMVACFDDLNHWELHMTGLAILVVSLCTQLDIESQWGWLVLAGAIYGSRFIAKSLCIIWYELRLSFWRYWSYHFLVSNRWRPCTEPYQSRCCILGQ